MFCVRSCWRLLLFPACCKDVCNELRELWLLPFWGGFFGPILLDVLICSCLVSFLECLFFALNTVWTSSSHHHTCLSMMCRPDFDMLCLQNKICLSRYTSNYFESTYKWSVLTFSFKYGFVRKLLFIFNFFYLEIMAKTHVISHQLKIICNMNKFKTHVNVTSYLQLQYENTMPPLICDLVLWRESRLK